MAHEEQGHCGIRLLGDTQSPFDIGNLICVACPAVNCACRLFRVEGCAPKAALVECEDDKATVGPSPMYMLIASHMFYKAMDEDDDAARGTSWLVSAGVERSRLGTGEPGFSEAGHGCVGPKPACGRLWGTA